MPAKKRKAVDKATSKYVYSHSHSNLTTTTATTAANSSASHLLSSLPSVLLGNIMSFIVCPLSSSDRLRRSTRLRAMASDVQSCSTVCKSSREAVTFAINEHGPRLPGLSPDEIGRIKNTAATIDLTVVRSDFLKALSEKWGGEEVVQGDEGENFTIKPLDVVVIDLSGTYEQFAEDVEKSYRKFLAVKAVEKKAQGGWGEKCMASALLDVFWHCHLLRPTKYYSDCLAITVGGDSGGDSGPTALIDHDPSYYASGKNSQREKLRQLYHVEEAYSRSDFTFNPIAIHSVSNIRDLGLDLWGEMDEDYGCG
jgi:hypothetical protein